MADRLKLTSQMITMGAVTSLTWETCLDQSKIFCGSFELALQVPDQAEEHWNQAEWGEAKGRPPGRAAPGPLGQQSRAAWG